MPGAFFAFLRPSVWLIILFILIAVILGYNYDIDVTIAAIIGMILGFLIALILRFR